jgi:hypothetical protein
MKKGSQPAGLIEIVRYLFPHALRQVVKNSHSEFDAVGWPFQITSRRPHLRSSHIKNIIFLRREAGAAASAPAAKAGMFVSVCLGWGASGNGRFGMKKDTLNIRRHPLFPKKTRHRGLNWITPGSQEQRSIGSFGLPAPQAQDTSQDCR